MGEQVPEVSKAHYNSSKSLFSSKSLTQSPSLRNGYSQRNPTSNGFAEIRFSLLAHRAG